MTDHPLHRLQAPRNPAEPGRPGRSLVESGRQRGPSRDQRRQPSRSIPHVPQPFDPAAPARAFGEFAAHLWTHPGELIKAQQKAASDWLKLWQSRRLARRRQARRSRRRPGARRPPLQRPRLERGAGLRLSQAGLSAHREARARDGRGGGGAGRGRPHPGRILHPAISERHLAGQFRLHQPGSDPQGDRYRLDQPPLRARQPARRRRRDSGHRPAPGEPGVRARGRHRRHSGQRRLPQRADGADPIRADDRRGVPAPDPLRPAAGEQILSARPAAQILA